MPGRLLIAAGVSLAVSSPALAGEAAAKADKPKPVETAAGVAGSVAGSAVGGPIGGFVGGAVGRAVAREAVRKPDKVEAAPAVAQAPQASTPEQRAAMAMQAPPAWADPGQAQRNQHAPPPPATAQDPQ